jgi:hypothetical protein
MNEHTSFRLTWTPLLSQDGYRWDGEPQDVFETSDHDALCEAWSDLMDSLRVFPGSMTDYPTIGKASEGGVVYSLHVIGRGTARVIES